VLRRIFEETYHPHVYMPPSSCARKLSCVLHAVFHSEFVSACCDAERQTHTQELLLLSNGSRDGRMGVRAAGVGGRRMQLEERGGQHNGKHKILSLQALSC
jgi:hypothetical protein